MRLLTPWMALCMVCAPRGDAQELSPFQHRELVLGTTKVRAEKAQLTVPENRRTFDSSAATGRTLRLTFARLRSTAEKPGPPLFFLPGGPGNPAIAAAQAPLWEPLLALGDVVLLDPRGVGESEPDLFFVPDNLDARLFFDDRDTAMDHMGEVLAQTAAHFADQDIDLSAYQPIEMVDDLEDLAEALGYDQVHLLGHSFGTILGQAWIRRYPQRVARLVSVGTAGPYDMMKRSSQLDRSLARLAEVIAADPRLGKEMPDFAAEVRQAIATVEDEPLVVEVTDRRTGDTVAVELGPFGLQLVLLFDLADTSDLPVFPRLVRSLQDRDPAVVQWFLDKRYQVLSHPPVFLLTCRAAAGASEERWALIQQEAEVSPFGLARCLFSPDTDEAFGVVDVGDAFREPVHSEVPTLFVSGTLDAATPPEQAEQVRRGFSRSGHVIVEYGGHEDLIRDPRVQVLVKDFLAGAPPEDHVLPRPPLRFAPLEGRDPAVRHPALDDR